MRVAIDARYLRSDFSGIGSFSANLIEALSVEDSDNEYTIITHDSFRGKLELGPNFTVVSDPAPPVSLRTLFSLHRVAQRAEADVLHTLFPLAPVAWKGKLLTTVHDLQPLLDPGFTGGRPAYKRFVYDMFYRTAYPYTMRRANFLVADSYATKSDLRRLFPDVADKTIVVHGGLDAEAWEEPSEADIERVREKYDIPERFVFFIGSTRPNKNLLMMLDAFERLTSKPEYADVIWVLVLKPDRFFDPLFARIRERNLLGRVHIHEQVNELEKRVFYRTAKLLYFVTKYEGFGLPVLEAQAQGLPVLASTHSALPEVAGNASLLADPDDAESILAALETFFSTPELGDRMRHMGFENARRFTWQRAAREILDMYNHLLS